EVARLPGSLKLQPGQASRVKGLFVDSLPQPLPPSTLGRRKMGFVFPWEDWLRNELASSTDAVLNHATLLDCCGLVPTAVRDVWRAFLSRRPGVRATDLLALVHLAAWVDRQLAPTNQSAYASQIGQVVHSPQKPQVEKAALD